MRTQKRKSPVKMICTIIILAVILAAGGYFAICRYYENADFICGTWINGIYCAGRTVEELNTALIDQGQQESITVFDGQGGSAVLPAADFGTLPGEAFSKEEDYRYGYEDKLREISSTQVPGEWIIDTFHSITYEVQPVWNYELKQEELRSYLEEKLAVMRKAAGIQTPVVRMMKTERGYELKDDKAQYLNRDKAAEVIYLAVMEGKDSVDLKKEGCYRKLPYTTEDKAVLALWEKVAAFQDFKLVYVMGEEEELVDSSVVCDWITMDKNGGFVMDKDGNLIPDKEKIKEYIEYLSEEYDTYGGTREFQTTEGNTVTITGGTYGNEIDKKAEVKYLTQAFSERKSERHEPVYLRKAWAQGKDDIGDTYIEIDLSGQKLYYYIDGNCEIETPIVTGNMMRKRDTPAAVCYVYGKQKNRILRGPGYASHVNYWMPVKGGIGIHDAKWRKEFGGDIYKTAGSHGCINTPYEAAEKLYDMVEIGTPVVMFY